MSRKNIYSGKFRGINAKLEERGYTAVDISHLGEGYIHMVTQGGEEYVPSMCPVHEYVPSTSLEDNQTKVTTLAESKEAEQLKMNGNSCFKKEKYHSAICFYSMAIKLDNTNAVLYANRAATKSQLNNHEGALKDCERAIDLDPTYSKAYCRMGLVYFSLQQYTMAVEYYEAAVMLDPNNSYFRNNLENAKKKVEEKK